MKEYLGVNVKGIIELGNEEFSPRDERFIQDEE
jgi:hypothetical protein